jgi:hypothetical protein
MTDSKWVPIRDSIIKYVTFGAKFVFPLLGTLAPVLGLPAWVGAVATSIVPQLMMIAEENSPAPGTGPMRKQQVLNATQEIMAVLEKNFTGIAKARFEALLPTLGLLIDQTVGVVNAIDKKVIADDVPSDPTSPLKTL